MKRQAEKYDTGCWYHSSYCKYMYQPCTQCFSYKNTVQEYHSNYMYKLYTQVNAAECHHNAVQFITISLTALWWQQRNFSQASNSQQTPHTSPSRASYVVSIVSILKKIDCVIMALNCRANDKWQWPSKHTRTGIVIELSIAPILDQFWSNIAWV